MEVKLAEGNFIVPILELSLGLTGIKGDAVSSNYSAAVLVRE